MLTVNLKSRTELLQQWRADIEANPRAFALNLTPENIRALVHDAIAAAHLNALLDRIGTPRLAHLEPEAPMDNTAEAEV